jgi:hypothetical protein
MSNSPPRSPLSTELTSKETPGTDIVPYDSEEEKEYYKKNPEKLFFTSRYKHTPQTGIMHNQEPGFTVLTNKVVEDDQYAGDILYMIDDNGELQEVNGNYAAEHQDEIYYDSRGRNGPTYDWTGKRNEENPFKRQRLNFGGKSKKRRSKRRRLTKRCKRKRTNRRKTR